MKREPLWLPVPGDPRYEVSNEGLLRRVLAGPGTWIGRISKGAQRSDGYLQVFGMDYNMMHQVVAAAFHGPCPPGQEVNHKDGVKGNTRSSNLEYVTRRENRMHALYVLSPHKATQRAEQARINGRVMKGRRWHKKIKGVA